MKNIFIIGAGFSSASLIDYLLRYAPDFGWQITVGSISLDQAESKISNRPHGRAIRFDINDPQMRIAEISQADIVVSMLPGSLHALVAEECLKQEKHLLTPSYITPDMQEMDREVQEKGLVFLNEMGVDPGIDHMSAMRVIDDIKQRGGQLLAFKSFCGGFVAPDCDDNPWNYKFSWNPRNVVIAGQGTASYIENGQYQYIPYHRLFSTTTPVEMPGYGGFEVYPNRDSLQYRELYGLNDIQTLIRGTMR
ncbi:MAG: saccharopine dehydrogenase NADP-binding domain-containing protein, partial [Desulfuromusa sp.]|nr:saccharopine dehydrogenase NADP-binding domain-containing protein [Desulfuromusa sp.]